MTKLIRNSDLNRVSLVLTAIGMNADDLTEFQANINNPDLYFSDGGLTWKELSNAILIEVQLKTRNASRQEVSSIVISPLELPGVTRPQNITPAMMQAANQMFSDILN